MGIAIAATKPEQFCLQVIQNLKSRSAPINVKQKANFLDKIASQANMAGFEYDSMQFPGKTAPSGTQPKLANTPTLFYEYEKPFCKGGTSSSTTSICDVTGSTAEQKGWMQVGIGKIAERHFTMTMEEFNSFCETPDDRKMTMIRRKAFEIKMEINREAIKAAYLECDAYVGGASSLGAGARTLNVVNSAGNALNADFAKIAKEYRKALYDGQIMTLGGETLADYTNVKMLQAMGTNGQGAMDPQELFGDTFLYDTEVDPIIEGLIGVGATGKSHGITLPYGNFGFFEWFEFRNYKEISLDNHVATTMMIDGMRYDYEINFDPCDKIWKIQLKKYYDFGAIPNSAYCNGQGLMFHWNFGCGDFACV